MALSSLPRMYLSWLRSGVLATSLAILAPLSQAEAITPSLQLQAKTQAQSRQTQQRVDQLAADSEKLLAQYQRITQQLDYQQAYSAELQQHVQDQDAEIATLKKAIADIQITRLHLLPLLREMLDTLKQFIRLDLPFEQQQRLAAVERLETLLSDSKVTIAEKFQRVMELYQSENDYNYNLGSYREQMLLDDQSYTLEFLRIGRLALYYRSLDGKHLAMWSVAEKQWQDISAHRAAAQQITKALRIAKEQQAPELLALPQPAGAQ